MQRFAAALISMSLCWGCAEPDPRPKPPDLSALVAGYADLTGEVTRESALRLVEEAATDLALVGDAQAFIGLIQRMFADLSGLGQGEEGLATQRRGLNVGGVEVDGGGWIVYHRFCPTANGMGARGTIEAIALIDIEAFEPVIWGTLADCRVDGAGIDGDLALHIDWVDGAPVGVIARIDGQVRWGEVAKQGEFSLRWQPDAIVTRYALGDLGGFLVGVDLATDRLLIEGRNGRFTCDDAGCTGPDGGFEW